MNTLKFALSKDDGQKGAKQSSNQKFNKSKSNTLWTLQVEGQQQLNEETLIQNDNVLAILSPLMHRHFQNDHSSVNEMMLDRIIEEFQKALGSERSQMSYLLLMEDKLGDVIDLAKEDYRRYLQEIVKLLHAKMLKIKNKNKTAELSHFQKINQNFSKKPPLRSTLLEVPMLQQSKLRSKQKITATGQLRNQSNQNKLNRLLSKEKNLNAKDLQRQDIQNQTTLQTNNESVSFSCVLATSMAVKQRRTKKDQEAHKHAKNYKCQNQKDEEKDEAFIFYRPKKGKR